jgi:DMSO/TMAO reductase YedYZ heme-binding membrane subunit
MAKKQKPSRMWVLAAGAAAMLALVVVLQASQGGGDAKRWVIRTAGLMGYFCVFAAILSSAYVVQLVRFFGRSFVKVHHAVSIAGLILISVHPLVVSISVLNHQVLMPSTQSWYSFFAYGGSVAWYLIGAAALIAAMRKRIGKPWKLLHALNYVAFWLATVHGWLVGTNVQGPVVRVIFALLALTVLWVLVQRRLADRRRKKRRRA